LKFRFIVIVVDCNDLVGWSKKRTKNKVEESNKQTFKTNEINNQTKLTIELRKEKEILICENFVDLALFHDFTISRVWALFACLSISFYEMPFVFNFSATAPLPLFYF
jgi:hypothetical protein